MITFRYVCLVCMLCCFVGAVIPGETVNAQCDIAAISDSKENGLYLLKAHQEFNKFSNVGVFSVKNLSDLVQKVTKYSTDNKCPCIQNLYFVGPGQPSRLDLGTLEPSEIFTETVAIAYSNEESWKPELAKLKKFMCGNNSTVWLIGSNVGHCNNAPDFLYNLAQTVNARVMAPVNKVHGGKIVEYMNKGKEYWQEANPTTKPSHKAAPDYKEDEKGPSQKWKEYFCPCNGLPYDGIQDCTNSCTVSLSCYANICGEYSANNAWDNYSGNPVMTAGTAGSWNEYGISQPTILKASPYSMWFSGWGTSDIDSIGYATSPDAINWTESSSNPVLISGASGDWDDYGVYGPSVIKEGNTYKMWYTGYSSSNKVAQIGYATSSDGINWEKHSGNPVLTIGGSGAWDEGGVGAPSVIKDGDTYKMWFGGSDISWWWLIGYATSPDGISWTKHPANPVIPYGNTGSWDEWGSDAPSVVKDGSTYHMLFIGFDSNNLASIGHATSTDGITWIESETNPHVSRSYGENSFDTENVGHPTLFKDSNESVFKAFYRGYNGSTWAIGYAASASLLGTGASTTTTTAGSSTTTTGLISTTTITPSTLLIGGSVTGAVSADVPIVLSGDMSQAVATNDEGDYVFEGLAEGGFYIVTPLFEGYTFEPPVYEFSALSSNVTDADFVSSKSSPCVLSKIYGEDSEEVELLRYYRNEVLSKTKVGQELIRLYYQLSPVIVDVMEEDEAFTEEVKDVIDGVLLLIGEEVK